MKKKLFKAHIVLIILAISLLLGFLLNSILLGIESFIYPKKFSDIVDKYADKYAVPPELIYATIKVESNFKTDAISSAGAIGLMQLLPSTYEWLAQGRGEESDPARLYDADTNINYGTYYLQYLYSRFGSWEKAIIAYNWGEGNFSAFIAENGYSEGRFSSIPIKETRSYVSKVTSTMEKYKNLYFERK